MYSIRESLESIAFQDKEFGNVLAGLLESLANLPSDRKRKDSEEYKTLIKLLKDRLGLKIKLIIDHPEIDAACYPGAWFNINTVMLNKDWRNINIIKFVEPARGREYEKRYKEFIKYKKDNWVDTKNAKVHGFFTEYEFEVFFNFVHLKKANLLPKEMSAIFMHEIGHIFTFIEYFDRTIETNQTLACVLNSLEDVNGDASNPKHIYRLKEIDKINGTEFIDDLENINNKEIITTVVLDKTMKAIQLKSNVDTFNYNNTAGESQADVFSIRFGLGRDLAVGLYKLHKSFGTDPRASFGALLAAHILEINKIVSIVLLGIYMPPLAIMLGSLHLLIAYTWMEHIRDYTYDDLPIRLTRMKEQLVTEIKNPKLSNEDKKELIKSIDNLDILIKNTFKYKPLLGQLFDLISPGARREKKAIEVQRKLEELAANDIFTKAAELSLIKI